ncbi:MAG: pyridoxal phosphate-dependent aminotransferase [Candidatus Adiutrix sp.]|jgi:aspartate/methionine/tyrosine aminotransferase|nr:pyridoxal phosphate-dependent aminotransferase [Candidatus Adiutrix sp.]
MKTAEIIKPEFRTAERTRGITPFIAMEILERAKALEAQGRRIIQLQLGEPDFDTPEVIKAAHQRALREGHTHYTPSLGDPELKEALSAHYRKRYKLDISPDRFFIVPGSSPGLMLLFSAILNPGDAVILPDPGYPCYDNMVKFFGGEARCVAAREEDGFLFRPEDLRSALGPEVRAILINSPANPTGAVIDEERLRFLASLGRLVISDEIYHGLTYGDEPEHSILEYTDRAVATGGFSKLFAMTGWRLGYLVLPPELTRTMLILSQNFLLSTSAAVQKAGVCALKEAWPEVEIMRQTYDRRRKLLLTGLSRLGLGVKSEPTGAFYVLANASHVSSDSFALAFDLLNKAGVGVAPGLDFGAAAEGFLRFSYANSEANIEEGLERLKTYLDQK